MKQKRPVSRPPEASSGRQNASHDRQKAVFGPASSQQPAQTQTLKKTAPARQTAASAERLMRIERRKARSRAVALSIFVLSIMLVTVLMIIAVMKQAKPQPRLVFIQNGEISHTVRSTGLIIREEVVFNAPAAGLLKPLVTEGSRVARGQKLALVIPSDKEDELKALQKCERDIVDLQTELMSAGKGAGAEAIFNESGASLSSIVNLVRGDAARGDLSNLQAYAASINVILEQRTARLMSINFQDSRLDALLETRRNLASALGLAAGTLVCEKPGIVSFRLDGLETVLNMGMADTIPKDDFEKYIAVPAAPAADNREVSQDQAVLRITAGLLQDLVFLLPNTSPDLLKKDTLISILLPDDGVTVENCRITRSESAGSGCLVTLMTDRKVEWLSDRRTVAAELTLSVTKGLKVPRSALMDLDEDAGEASIMIISKGYTRTCLVKVTDMDRDNAIISAIESETYKPEVSMILVANPAAVEAGDFIGN